MHFIIKLSRKDLDDLTILRDVWLAKADDDPDSVVFRTTYFWMKWMVGRAKPADLPTKGE